VRSLLGVPENLWGQGLLTLACLQDLSQAKARWGPAADGFFSLFGTKVLLPGIGDMGTLEAVSRLAGQADVVVRSVNTSAWWTGHPSASTTRSPRLQARLPVDEAHSLPPGTALVIAGARPPRL
jgi:type IV secretion system protein VirD4